MFDLYLIQGGYNEAALYAIVALLGLILGSFSTFLIYRLPRRMPIFSFQNRHNISARRSICPDCLKPLRVYNLIPLFSWCLQRGKSNCCKKPIPYWYPFAEVLTMALTVIGLWHYGLAKELAIWTLSAPLLTAMLVIDWQHKIIPDKLNLSLGILGIGYVLVSGLSLPQQVLSSIVYGGFSWGLRWAGEKVMKREALGLGDVKFFFVVGIWLPLQLFSPFLFIAGISGILMALAMRLKTRDPQIPFGPALEIAFILCLLFAEQILAFVKAPALPL